MTRGPRTRRQHSLARKRQDNEQRSMLLQLNDDVLEKVLSFLEGRDLAVLETVCTHFRYGSWVAVNRVAMPETSAKRKLESLELGEMPPGFRCEDGILRFRRANDVRADSLFPRHRPRGRDPIRDSSSAARPSRHHCRSVAPAEPFVFSRDVRIRRSTSTSDAPTSSRLSESGEYLPSVFLLARPLAARLPRQQHLAPLTLPANDPPYVPPPNPRRKMKWSRKLAVVELRDAPRPQ